MPFAFAQVAIGCWALQNYLVDDLGQLVGTEETELLAELEFLVIGYVFSIVGKETGRPLLLIFLGRFWIMTRITDWNSDVHIGEVVLHHFLEGALQLLSDGVDP